MKILKIILILLVPAFGFVGCKKADLKRECSESNSVKNESTDKNEVQSRPSKDITNSDSSNDLSGVSEVKQDDSDGSEIVGAGDDDRDGGDKKKKK